MARDGNITSDLYAGDHNVPEPHDDDERPPLGAAILIPPFAGWIASGIGLRATWHALCRSFFIEPPDDTWDDYI